MNLYRKIYLDVIEEIRSGNLKIGDKLPTEKAMSEKYKVSRITTKKALDLLAQEKIIERFQGKGSFVSSGHIKNQESKKEASVKALPHLSGLVGLIIPDFSDVFGLKQVKMIEEKCSEYNYHLVIKRTLGYAEEEKKAINSLVDKGLDGLIIIPAHGTHYNHDLLRLVVDKYPLVLLDRYIKGIPASSVHINNQKATIMAIKYLLEKGHRELAFISPPKEGASSIEEREIGFHIAFSDQNLPVNNNYFLLDIQSSIPKNFSSDNVKEIAENDRRKIEEFLKKNPEITAIFCTDYTIANMVYSVLESLGKKIPEEYAIVCFDSVSTTNGNPLFTHISQREDKMGEEAVHLLMKQVNGEYDPKHVEVDFDFIIGETT
ncbi:GntR family transcriptional regulator [Oceanobacillus sojae]|uniref:GntR family transcriptional regulator n=1 Tax=Oceanobacillus neutriphilus TaxID=531815 RepID=A0ABQ2NP06_9BACI|nr:GntR family transcriptional regulator [Oceanobacillus sojae]GGP07674.1 GntR family transcriptional regulator [Oceanobacillus neutriphilus]